jgi:uroporphyrinogen decarboxylase
MSGESMTPQERWLAVLNREVPDRVPMDYWATPEATSQLARHLGGKGHAPKASERSTRSLSPWGGWAAGGGWKTAGAWTADEFLVFDRLHIDTVVVVQPAYCGPSAPPDTDAFGNRFRDVDYGSGAYAECVYHPLAQYRSVAEVASHYTWPTVDWFDYSVIPEQISGKEQYPICGGGSEPFLLYTYLRGMEQAFMDLVLNPELVRYSLGKLFDLCYENTRRIFERLPGRVTLSYIAEDFGSQERLLISRETIREFLLPGMKRMIDLVHEAGAYVFFHSDGAIREILPDMIDLGIDILNPIQWRCRGMDRQKLKEEFGDRVIFHGGVDNQQTLPFGSVEDVRQEVRYNLEVLGKHGGYILAPCHNIQAVGPPENVVAMYRTALEYS